MAEQVAVPRRNLLPKPAELSFAEAACLPTAWLTAYRMLFVKSGLRPGQTVLVQGASGGVATALIVLGRAAGYRIWVTGRNEEKRAAALALGADQAFESGARLPERVDGVMETVGEATWSHSIKSLKPGGVLVTSGATTGFNPGAELNRVFFTQLSVIGSTMGTRERARVADPAVQRHRHPPADRRRTAAGAGPGGLRADARGADEREDRLHPVSAGAGRPGRRGAAGRRRRGRRAPVRRPGADGGRRSRGAGLRGRRDRQQPGLRRRRRSRCSCWPAAPTGSTPARWPR